MSVLEIQQMPRHEKLRLMEELWTDLSREDADLDSPAWHGEVLRETAGRLDAGMETSLDWDQAKASFHENSYPNT
jgi:hypothetical protein